MSLLPENNAARMMVQSSKKLNSRRKKICRLESAGAAGLASFGIRKKDYWFAARCRADWSNSAKTPMPLRIFFQGGEELRLAKIGPESLRDHQFGVGNLPKEKIAQTHFAAGADEHVRVRPFARVKMVGHDLLSDFGRLELALLHLGGDVA